MASKEDRAAVRQLVQRVIDSHGRRESGWGDDCDLMKWLRAKARENTPGGVDAVREQLVSREDWPAKASFNSIREVFYLVKRGDITPEEQDRLQTVYARGLAMKPWEYARAHVERLMAEHGEEVAPEAAKVLVDYLADKHPNPKAFLAQPHVRGKLHPDVDLTDLPAPDFKGIERHRIRGERGERMRQMPPMRGRSRPHQRAG